MSKTITVRLKNRRPSDVSAYIKSIVAACPDDAKLNLEIDCSPSKRKSSNARKDEQMETKVNAKVSDRLDQLAKAALEFKADEELLRKIQRQVGHAAEARGGIKRWLGDTAREGWRVLVKVFTESLIGGGGAV